MVTLEYDYRTGECYDCGEDKVEHCEKQYDTEESLLNDLQTLPDKEDVVFNSIHVFGGNVTKIAKIVLREG